MDRRTFLTATASATLVTVAGCGGSDTQAPDSAAEIRIVDNSFDPLQTSVDTGREVVWTNAGSTTHTVDSQTFHDVAEVWSIDADTLDPGDSTSFTFEESGVYEYSCSIHGGSNMCGVVLVGDASLDQQLPCESSIDRNGDGGNESS